MLYALTRAIARFALRWYYRDIQVEGVSRIPHDRPLLLVVNHPNALVDAMLVIWALPWRVMITAKSTIFVNPILATVLRWLGVLPLHRTSDADKSGVRTDAARNRSTFEAVIDALEHRRTVLIFPEGISHDSPSLAPLKSGAARMALEAKSAGNAPGLLVVPIGLVFERKEAPRSRVLVQVGEPIEMDRWTAREGQREVDALTADIDTRLRAVTLNYATVDDAVRATQLASVIAVLFEGLPEISDGHRRLGDETIIARRIDELTPLLAAAGPAMRARADQLVRRLDAVQRIATKHGVLLEDVGIELAIAPAARFVVREGWILAVGGPVALWGRLNHWLPFRAARAIAMRSVASAADPAMYTVLAGAALVVVAYLAQTIVVGLIWGPLVATAYLVSLPLAADINFYLSERFDRAAQRARAFLRFRRDRGLQRRLEAELTVLRDDVAAFDRALGALRGAASA
jgi:glycerol-3-phosphate O-acyltransferase/dihydroxyacetone phosphate acyltransferase